MSDQVGNQNVGFLMSRLICTLTIMKHDQKLTNVISVLPKIRVNMSLVVRKPVFGVSDQVRHKPGSTATEAGERLEISDLGSRGIVLSVYSENKGADQLRSYCAADLRL